MIQTPQRVTRKIRYLHKDRRYTCVVELTVDVDAIAFRLGSKAAGTKRKRSIALNGKIVAAVHSIEPEVAA